MKYHSNKKTARNMRAVFFAHKEIAYKIYKQFTVEELTWSIWLVENHQVEQKCHAFHSYLSQPTTVSIMR